MKKILIIENIHESGIKLIEDRKDFGGISGYFGIGSELWWAGGWYLWDQGICDEDGEAVCTLCSGFLEVYEWDEFEEGFGLEAESKE